MLGRPSPAVQLEDTSLVHREVFIRLVIKGTRAAAIGRIYSVSALAVAIAIADRPCTEAGRLISR